MIQSFFTSINIAAKLARPPVIRGLLISGMLFSIVGMSACRVLPKPQDAPVIYRLSVLEIIKSSPIIPSTVINVESFTASKPLDSASISLSPDGRKLTIAGGAKWAEPIPALLRDVLIDHLANNPNITGIIPKGNTRVPYRLNVDIRRFEAVFDQGEHSAPVAIVQLNLALTDTKKRALIGRYTVSTRARAQQARISKIVEAQDKATQQALNEISQWLEAQILGVNQPLN